VCDESKAMGVMLGGRNANEDRPHFTSVASGCHSICYELRKLSLLSYELRCRGICQFGRAFRPKEKPATASYEVFITEE
jgi:hypothetical protein